MSISYRSSFSTSELIFTYILTRTPGNLGERGSTSRHWLLRKKDLTETDLVPVPSQIENYATRTHTRDVGSVRNKPAAAEGEELEQQGQTQ